MNGKKVFYSELAYVFGMVVLALGTAMMERADFGMSMVVAPAYLVHLRISQAFPAFTFGMAEYCLQAVLLIGIAMITRRRKIKYVLSFGTAVFYGFTLDWNDPIRCVCWTNRVLCVWNVFMRCRRFAVLSYIPSAGGLRTICKRNFREIRNGHSQNKDGL